MSLPDLHQVILRWPNTDANQVIVTGTFDQWSSSVRLVRKPDGFEAPVLIPWQDKIAYKFIVDGRWMTNDTEPTEIDGSFINNVYTAPPKPALPKPGQLTAPPSYHSESEAEPGHTDKVPEHSDEPASTVADEVEAAVTPAVQVVPNTQEVERSSDETPEHERSTDVLLPAVVPLTTPPEEAAAGPVEDVSEPESGPVPTANEPFLEPAQVEAPGSAAFEPAPELVRVEEVSSTVPEPVPEPARVEAPAIEPVPEPARVDEPAIEAVPEPEPVDEPSAASAPAPQTESAPAEGTIPTDAIEPIPAVAPEPKPEEAAAQQLDAPSSSPPTSMPSASGVNGHTKSPSTGSASTAAPTVSTTPLRKASRKFSFPARDKSGNSSPTGSSRFSIQQKREKRHSLLGKLKDLFSDKDKERKEKA